MSYLRVRGSYVVVVFALFAMLHSFAPGTARAQSNSGIVQGTVMDPSNAVVPGAVVRVENPVSGYTRQATTDTGGNFAFTNIPFNPYHLTVSAQGFATTAQDVEVRSSVPVALKIGLKIGSTLATIIVESGSEDLIETESTPHTDVDRALFDKLPLESRSSSVSSLVTLASPGVVADSNGLFHGLGDHAENSFSVDGQPITDQQSKVFSNQIPVDSIQSMTVISGAPPAEFGGKTSLIINVTTRSGLGQTRPTGSLTASYGSFGSSSGNLDVAFGGKNWGNFLSASGLNTGRFLDPPEFQVMHARGNEENLFDRVDFQVSEADTLRLNLGYTRSWFQTPNSFDAAFAGQDQRAQIRTFNIAPSWTRLIGSTMVFNLGAFLRQDQFAYYPSGDPFADQPETLNQQRRLTNAGARADLSYVKGIHNFKVGAVFQHTFLTENFGFGVTDPTFNAPCLDASGDPSPNPAPTNPALCHPPFTPAGFHADGDFVPQLLPFDLTRGGHLFAFHGHADIKEYALYAQDSISKGNWSFNLGLRGDFYRGLSRDNVAQPRVGVAYNIRRTNTVLRFSYARVMESPFNENLMVASATANPVLAAVIGTTAPILPGRRNEFHAGFQQAFGRHLVVDGDYLWKYTHNSYDFGVLGDTPIFFPIAWNQSKISGFSIRVNVPEFHGFTAYTVMSNVKARFFFPQVGGPGADPTTFGPVFRIDHDQKFQQTTHLQYQPRPSWPWIGFNWRYDNGIVAGEVPVATDPTTPVDLTRLTPDQQMQAGLFCGSVVPTFTAPLTACAPSLYGSTRISLPAPGTANDDHNPPRVAPRHLFDLGLGDDNLFRADRYKWSLRFTIVNLTNKVALYNFLSTFSGTHFITPRTYTAEVGFHF